MTDITEDRLALLQTMQEKQAAVSLMLDGIEKITEGGIEGIVFVALERPDLILEALQDLTQVVRLQQQETVKLTEDWFAAQDAIQMVSSWIPKK